MEWVILEMRDYIGLFIKKKSNLCDQKKIEMIGLIFLFYIKIGETFKTGGRFLTFFFFQLRVAHSPKNYVHESMLDSFLELVIWGHEHECLVTPQQSTISDYYITQPGSSVATALSEGEAKKK